ncbi:MAG: hypothetical protein AAGK71_08010 [Pseudomonadota bacterium]
MAVKDTLDKITQRHSDVIGAMVLHNGSVQHNLESPYDVLEIDAILETFTEIFEQTEILADEGYDFGEVMIDFANHSFIVRTIENGLLAVLAPQMQRGQLVKLHVGLGIFGKAVQKAIEEEGATPASDIVEQTAPPVEEQEVPTSEPQPVEIAAGDDEDAPADESTLSSMLGFGKKRRGNFRGTKELLASRVAAAEAEAQAEDAVSEPTPKEVDAQGDEIPLRPDGTPMKKKFYRGSVYWE